MNARHARGFVLALLLAVFAVLGITGSIVWSRLSADRIAQRAGERRVQALWLGRSAVLLERPAKREVVIDGEAAALIVTRSGNTTTAQVRLPRWGEARVTLVRGPTPAWTESWDSVPR